MTVVCVPIAEREALVSRLARAVETRAQVAEAQEALIARRDRLVAQGVQSAQADIISEVVSPQARQLIAQLALPILRGSIEFLEESLKITATSASSITVRSVGDVSDVFIGYSGDLHFVPNYDEHSTIVYDFKLNGDIPVFLPEFESRAYTRGERIFDIPAGTTVELEMFIYNYDSSLITPKASFFVELYSPDESPTLENDIVQNEYTYGPRWKSVRPPGAPLNFPYASSPESGRRLIGEYTRDVLNAVGLEGDAANALYATADRIARHESGWVLNIPQSGFDARPREGSDPSPGQNFLDVGPLNRGISPPTTHRPVEAPLRTAFGAFQVVRDTFRLLASRYSGTLGITRQWSTTKKWQWEVHEKYQVYLPVLDLYHNVWKPGLEKQIPYLYLGAVSYATIVGISYGPNYMTLFDQEPGDSAALRAKLVWDRRDWLDDDKEDAGINTKIDHIVDRFTYVSSNRSYGNKFTFAAHEEYGSLFALSPNLRPER